MRELEGMKGKQSIPQRMERVMKPTPGPRAPGNITAISLHAEIEKELQHWIGTLSNPQLPAPRSVHGILGWVAFNAYDIAQQDDAEAFQDDLNHWTRTVEKAVGRGPTMQLIASVATNAKNKHTSAAMAADYVTAALGRRFTRKQIAYWGRAGYITTVKNNGRIAYNLSEVCDFAATYHDRRKDN